MVENKEMAEFFQSIYDGAAKEVPSMRVEGLGQKAADKLYRQIVDGAEDFVTSLWEIDAIK